MKDYIMTEQTERAMDRMLPRVANWDIEESVKHHSKAMGTLEAIWYTKAAQAKESGNEILYRKCYAMYERLVRFHKDADVLAFEHGNVAMPRDGSR